MWIQEHGGRIWVRNQDVRVMFLSVSSHGGQALVFVFTPLADVDGPLFVVIYRDVASK